MIVVVAGSMLAVGVYRHGMKQCELAYMTQPATVVNTVSLHPAIQGTGKTRRHSSRMRSARLPTVRISVTTTRCRYQWEGVGPQVNKFEQVSSDDQQISLVGGSQV